jgi:hypothetical protein
MELDQVRHLGPTFGEEVYGVEQASANARALPENFRFISPQILQGVIAKEDTSTGLCGEGEPCVARVIGYLQRGSDGVGQIQQQRIASTIALGYAAASYGPGVPPLHFGCSSRASR